MKIHQLFEAEFDPMFAEYIRWEQLINTKLVVTTNDVDDEFYVIENTPSLTPQQFENLVKKSFPQHVLDSWQFGETCPLMIILSPEPYYNCLSNSDYLWKLGKYSLRKWVDSNFTITSMTWPEFVARIDSRVESFDNDFEG